MATFSVRLLQLFFTSYFLLQCTTNSWVVVKLLVLDWSSSTAGWKKSIQQRWRKKTTQHKMEVTKESVCGCVQSFSWSFPTHCPPPTVQYILLCLMRVPTPTCYTSSHITWLHNCKKAQQRLCKKPQTLSFCFS